MREIEIFQVDAFATSVFSGNPAAVCPLREWLPDATLQAIAEENNLSETAFIVTEKGQRRIRWFTPREEVPLCGHATLASGFVVLNYLEPSARSVEFASASGPLRVERKGDRFVLDFPVVRAAPCSSPPPALRDGLGCPFDEVLVSIGDPNYLVILEGEDRIRAAKPDLAALETLHPHGVVISAPGGDVDFVSRYFAPGSGIPEDPVTGSIHCALAPYWARRLGKDRMEAQQLSRRGGRIGVELRGERVFLSGAAVCYARGAIFV
jgi:PhzF family phenazine biosynthesis protein